MAQDQWTLQEKKKSQPMHGPQLQARVVAANRTVRTTCASILAHMEMNRGQSKTEQNGANDEGSGHGMAKASRHTQPAELGRCRQTKPADDPTGTGLEETQLQTIRPVQASQQNNSHRCWLASRRAVQVVGGSVVVLALKRWAQTYPTCLPPTYRLCLSLYIPPPLIWKKPNLAPTYFFVFIFFIFPSTSPL